MRIAIYGLGYVGWVSAAAQLMLDLPVDPAITLWACPSETSGTAAVGR